MKDIAQKTKTVLSQYVDVDINQIQSNASFIQALDLHPIDVMQLMVQIEKEFNIEFSDDHITKVDKLEDLIDYIQEASNNKQPTLLQRIKDVTIEQLAVDEDEIDLNTSFIKDLGADSLDLAELIIALEKELEIDLPNEKMDHIQTVQDVLSCVKEVLQQSTVQQIKSILETHPRKIYPYARFSQDLTQNADLVKVIQSIKDKFQVDISNQMSNLNSVSSLIQYIESTKPSTIE